MSMWQGQRIQEIDVTDANAGREHTVLLDVREADEWEAGHAPGAKWVRLGELESAALRDPDQPSHRVRVPIGCAFGQGHRATRPVGLRRREHGRRHEGVGRAGSSRRTRRRHPGPSHLSRDPRAFADSPADIALGTELVREYVVATAAETGQDVEMILAIVPDLRDFAGRYLRGGAFLVAENGAESTGRSRAASGSRRVPTARAR